MADILKKVNWTAVSAVLALLASIANVVWMASAFAAKTEDGVATMKVQIVGLETVGKDHGTRVAVLENHIFYIREDLQHIKRLLTERK